MMKRLFTALSIFALSSVSAWSESGRTPFSTTMRGDFRRLATLAQRHFIGNEQSPALDVPLHFSGLLPGVGKFNVSLSRVQTRSWSAYREVNGSMRPDTSKLLLFRGISALPGSQKGRVSASLFEEDGVPTFSIKLRHIGGHGAGFYALKTAVVEANQQHVTQMVASQRTGAVRRMPQAALAGLQFDSLEAPKVTGGSSTQATPRAEAATQLRVLLLATEADPSYSQRYGSSANNQIASIIAAANVIYERDISTTLSISRQVARSASSQGNVSANTLLSDFANANVSNHYLGDADIFHLFSARDFDGLTVGLAYVAQACVHQPDNETYAYGVSQDYNASVNYLIVAHEIGHNIGCEHDSASQPPSLMYPSAGTEQNYFSATSKNQVAAHFNQYGSACLGGFRNAGETPTPTPVPPDGGGATPTPTSNDPNPTPSTGSGPGGGDSGGADTPVVFLQAAISRGGDFFLDVSSDRLLQNCIVDMITASDRNMSLSLGTLFSAEFSGTTFQGDGYIPRAGRRDASGKAYVYIQGRFACAGYPTFMSEVTRVNAASVRSRRTPIGLKSWVRNLGRSTELSAP